VALRYVIKARARREIERAARWWSENRLDAPGAVRIDLESALFVLIHHPGLGRKVDTGRPIQVRRYLMSGTQYWLYYRIKGNLLEVLSVWGAGRGFGPKL
jgi:plasmid stabilization system protein ParE